MRPVLPALIALLFVACGNAAQPPATVPTAIPTAKPLPTPEFYVFEGSGDDEISMSLSQGEWLVISTVSNPDLYAQTAEWIICDHQGRCAVEFYKPENPAYWVTVETLDIGGPLNLAAGLITIHVTCHRLVDWSFSVTKV